MQVVLIKHEGSSIGWQLVADNEQDRLVLGTIRNMVFWGFDDTSIKYNGVKEWEQDNRYAQVLEWRQKKFKNVKII